MFFQTTIMINAWSKEEVKDDLLNVFVRIERESRIFGRKWEILRAGFAWVQHIFMSEQGINTWPRILAVKLCEST